MKLLLTFSTNISLKDWEKLGILDREVFLYRKLSQKGFIIKFLTYGDNSDLKYSKLLNKIEIIPIKERISSRIQFVKVLLFPLFNRHIFKNVDIIKTNQMDGSWITWFAKLFYRKKIIIRCGFEALKTFLYKYKYLYNREISKFFLFFYYIIEWISYKLADIIISTNINEKNFIIKYFKINPEKIILIPNFIEINKFKPININKKENSLLFIGSLNEFKNLENLIDSLTHVKNVSLDIIGDGELKEILIKKVEELGLTSKVKFLGRFPNTELPAIISKYEIFILPSLSEGNPKALLEAMSCGLPCIGTNIPSIKEIITHKKNGYLCNMGSISIAKAINNLLENKELREEIGKNARSYIIKNYSINTIYQKEYEIYRSLSNK